MNPNAFRFVFPAVLNRLDYAHKLTLADVSPVEVPDAREVLRWYFSEMTGGVAYERGVNAPWNTGAPHTLTRDNFSNARNVSSTRLQDFAASVGQLPSQGKAKKGSIYSSFFFWKWIHKPMRTTTKYRTNRR